MYCTYLFKVCRFEAVPRNYGDDPAPEKWYICSSSERVKKSANQRTQQKSPEFIPDTGDKSPARLYQPDGLNRRPALGPTLRLPPYGKKYATRRELLLIKNYNNLMKSPSLFRCFCGIGRSLGWVKIKSASNLSFSEKLASLHIAFMIAV